MGLCDNEASWDVSLGNQLKSFLLGFLLQAQANLGGKLLLDEVWVGLSMF